MPSNLPCRGMSLAAATFITLAFGGRHLVAQQTSRVVPTMTIRAHTRLVVVDVVVTDKKSHPISTLRAENFVVQENGTSQKIAIFIPPTSNRTVAAPATKDIFSNHPETVNPTGVPTVLLLDAANSTFQDQAYARSQMLKYVVEQEQHGVPMAVVALTDRLHVLQQFTSDPKILLTAIKNFTPHESILQAEGATSASRVPRDATGIAVARSIAVAQGEIASFASLQVGQDLERRTLITIEAMRCLVRILGGLPGRKSIVWLTSTLPFDLIPDDRPITDLEMATQVTGSAALRGAGAFAAQQRTLHRLEIRQAEAQLASANIAIYPVDLHGLVGGVDVMASPSSVNHTVATPGTIIDNNDIHGADIANAALAQSASLQPSQGTMQEVAAETGGKEYSNQNEIKRGVVLATADDTASYTLGYYPENRNWDGKYRSIRVKVTENGAQVRSRKGYFAVDPRQTDGRALEHNVAAALEVNAPATQVWFMAQAKPTDPGKTRVLFLVDAHTITAEDSGGNRNLNMSLYASLYDAGGKNLGTRNVKVDKAFDSATYQQIVEKGMMVPIDMDVPTGAKELRLAVLDNKTGFIGTVSGPLGQ